MILSANNKASVSFCDKYLFCNIKKTISYYKISKQQWYPYQNTNFMYFEINNDKWYKAIDITTFLNYAKSRNCISTNISKCNKLCFLELLVLANKNNIFLLRKNYLDPKTVFINSKGLIQLLLKSEKTSAIELAEHFNINVHQKFTRQEIDIVCELESFCKEANIRYKDHYIYTYKKNRYEIDYYLIDYKIAIEIDELNHRNYDKKYEKQRQKFLSDELQCQFIRCNPDDPNFSISGLLGKIHAAILNKA